VKKKRGKEEERSFSSGIASFLLWLYILSRRKKGKKMKR